MIEREFPTQQEEGKNSQENTPPCLQVGIEDISFLHGKNLMEIFSNDEGSRSFIEKLSEADFLNLLNQVNGTLRNKNKEDWKMDGYENGGSVALMFPGGGRVGYMPPPFEQRPVLFVQVLQTMKEMLRDVRSLEDVAILLSSSINAIHAYADANGRTSRLFYLLLTQRLSEDSKTKIKEAISEGGSDVIDINPEMIEAELRDVLIEKIKFDKPQGDWMSRHNRKDIAFNKNLPEWLKTELREILSDRTFSAIALHKFLKDMSFSEKYLVHYPEREGLAGKRVPEMNKVDVDELFADIDEKQAMEIVTVYREIKIEMAQLLVDCIAHPNKSEYVINKGGTILEEFKRKIKQHVDFYASNLK